LNLFLHRVDEGLKRAFDKKTGVINTYFENKVTEYRIRKEAGKEKKNWQHHTCIEVLKFEQKPLPLFLEGPMHYLRILKDRDPAGRFHASVKKSGLYDRKLKMYKVNASLARASIDIGRLKIFTPGWLENESVWLHMEYKYLLELLRNGLVNEYYKAIQTALVPYMDPGVYGRSIFENVSFIVSSAHPDTKIHGQGFIARLSGSTAEFLSIWLVMNVGLKPFYMEGGQLCLRFQPLLKGTLFTRKKEIVKNFSKADPLYNDLSTAKELYEEIILSQNSYLFKFLGNTVVIYHNPDRKDTFGPKRARIKRIDLIYNNDETHMIEGAVLREPFSYDVRNGRIKRVDVLFG